MSSDTNCKLEPIDIDTPATPGSTPASTPQFSDLDTDSSTSRDSSPEPGHPSARSIAARNRNRNPCASCSLNRMKCELILDGKRRLCKKCDRRGLSQCQEGGARDSTFIHYTPGPNRNGKVRSSASKNVMAEYGQPLKAPITPPRQAQPQPQQQQLPNIAMNNNFAIVPEPMGPGGQLTINIYVMGGGTNAVCEILRGILPGVSSGCQRQEQTPPAYTV